MPIPIYYVCFLEDYYPKKAIINIEAVDFFRRCAFERADLMLSSAIDTKSNLNSEIFENKLWLG